MERHCQRHGPRCLMNTLVLIVAALVCLLLGTWLLVTRD